MVFLVKSPFYLFRLGNCGNNIKENTRPFVCDSGGAHGVAPPPSRAMVLPRASWLASPPPFELVGKIFIFLFYHLQATRRVKEIF
jgi:hypothetical protein